MKIKISISWKKRKINLKWRFQMKEHKIIQKTKKKVKKEEKKGNWFFFFFHFLDFEIWIFDFFKFFIFLFPIIIIIIFWFQFIILTSSFALLPISFAVISEWILLFFSRRRLLWRHRQRHPILAVFVCLPWTRSLHIWRTRQEFQREREQDRNRRHEFRRSEQWDWLRCLRERSFRCRHRRLGFTLNDSRWSTTNENGCCCGL